MFLVFFACHMCTSLFWEHPFFNYNILHKHHSFKNICSYLISLTLCRRFRNENLSLFLKIFTGNIYQKIFGRFDVKIFRGVIFLEDKLRELYFTHYKMVVKVAYGILGNTEAAEDVASDVFLKLI